MMKTMIVMAQTSHLRESSELSVYRRLKYETDFLKVLFPWPSPDPVLLLLNSTPMTLSMVLPEELAGAIPLIDKFQVNIVCGASQVLDYSLNI